MLTGQARRSAYQLQCQIHAVWALCSVMALSMILRAAGVAIVNNPLDRVIDFQGKADAQTAQRNPHADGCLTATYPEVEKEDGRNIVNYPNQGRVSPASSMSCVTLNW